MADLHRVVEEVYINSLGRNVKNEKKNKGKTNI